MRSTELMSFSYSKCNAIVSPPKFSIGMTRLLYICTLLVRMQMMSIEISFRPDCCRFHSFVAIMRSTKVNSVRDYILRFWPRKNKDAIDILTLNLVQKWYCDIVSLIKDWFFFAKTIPKNPSDPRIPVQYIFKIESLELGFLLVVLDYWGFLKCKLSGFEFSRTHFISFR